MDDRIEHRVSIRASADRVWDLVSRPGWWLPGPESSPARGVGRVAVPQGGDSVPCVIDVVRFEPRGYVAFRWANAFGGIMPGRNRCYPARLFSSSPPGARVRCPPVVTSRSCLVPRASLLGPDTGAPFGSEARSFLASRSSVAAAARPLARRTGTG
jgi:hypothetical protein